MTIQIRLTMCWNSFKTP
ncbi:unnamed protein product [Staurois parvus]|uniref:Uncharacterized protein n=1 Tax=Staurois parvus TaxID=386267 RepID=A0ABN9FDB1_9NEOB|nr:unnamed protein product [Staurois parvus]